ncbi:Site-specific recombinase XerD [Roseicitreum antarcticum]|uniref:Site-specific recombinase XerD n=3 Tax=Roseicitreum antarcticum TaxID=564137 RepID=A0A1H3EXB2_9RHOB|nr:site-specific integrase [Roseicitreum antarcticum]SDX82609.1 Site-specific recombinase XerD [Roseicitreum antarcticum]
MRDYRIGRLNGRFVVTWHEDGQRRRFRLNATTAREAEAEARQVIIEASAPAGAATVAEIWELYRSDRKGRVIAESMRHTGKAILPAFGHFLPDQITSQDCRNQIDAWRVDGKHDGTIWTRMNHLRIVLSWAQKMRVIERAPYIERPEQPAPRDRYLSQAEADRLIDAEAGPHVKLAIILMLTTAARVTAALELTWDRVDFERGQVRLATGEGRKKGRATVPMNNTLRAALESARMAALSDHVIEWGGKPVKSIKRGFASAVKNAKLSDVSPHVLRHTAAVRMAEAGRPMSEIAQYLGHTNTATTEKTYARYSPEHLRTAADSLEFTRLKIVR